MHGCYSYIILTEKLNIQPIAGPSKQSTKSIPQIIVIPDDYDMAEIPDPFPFPATYETNIDVALLTGNYTSTNLICS